MALKIFYMTFGCKVNQYESQNLAERFAADGHIRAESLENADVCIINSCTVTAQSDTKCRHFLNKVKRVNPDCILLLTGCFPQAFPEQAKSLADCDIICGNKDKTLIPQLVYDYIAKRERTVHIPKHTLRPSFEPMCNALAEDKTRAYIKIQDGCDLYCTYCIIPYARGHICSKPLNEIKREVELLVDSGHKEIILTGINLCCYGRDFGNGTRMIDAIEQACSVEGDFRVRLGSMEPEMISDEDISRMKALPKLCPQFHLSLQSGCDKTLADMNRHYNTDKYYTLCQKLRQAFPGCAITTDIMVGFPQETNEDFEQSLEFAKKIGFASAHIFPYSRRSGTAADKLDRQIDRHTKAKRAARMAEVCRQSQLEYNRSFIGKTVDVLFERESSSEFHQGHIAEYVLVKIPKYSEKSFCREIHRVRITKAETDFCIGEIIEK